MISVRFQGKPFNITVIQAYAPTRNAKADVEWFALQTNWDYFVFFLRLHPTTAFWTFWLTMRATPFLLKDSSYSSGYNIVTWIKFSHSHPFWASQVAWWVKNPPAVQESRRRGFDPWVGKVSWRKAWQPTPVILENSMDRGSWRATVHGVIGVGISEATEHSTCSHPF